MHRKGNKIVANYIQNFHKMHTLDYVHILVANTYVFAT
jgi:hypothetical protein